MKSKLRASNISIESISPDRDIWVHVVIQEVIYDGDNLVNVIPSYDRFSKAASAFMFRDYKYHNDNNSETIKGYEIMEVITQVVVEWMKERYTVEEDIDGNLWLKK